MKVYAALLIAALCATAIAQAQDEPEKPMSFREKMAARAKELQAKASQALEHAKAKGKEVAQEINKIFGEKKGQSLEQLQKLEAKLKELQQSATPALEKAKDEATTMIKAQIEDIKKQIQAIIKDKLSSSSPTPQ